MYRLLLILLLFYSFKSFSAYYEITAGSTDFVGHICAADSFHACGLLPSTYNDKPQQGGTLNGGTTGGITQYYGMYSDCWSGCTKYYFILNAKTLPSCTTAAQCYPIAEAQCTAQGKAVDTYNFLGTDSFEVTCKDVVTEDEKCRDNMEQQCANNFGLSTYEYLDNGDGTTSCTGVCTDGTIPTPDTDDGCIATLENNYCDEVEPPSDLDFGSGGSGSSVDPSETTAEDNVNDIPYEADGTNADSETGFSTIQGDKLINEVVKSRNDNTKNLASTTETTNQTIVEKSDDISNTVSNSANGIIDAVNDIAPFYDGNIVDAVNGLNGGIDDLGTKIDGVKDALGADYVTSLTFADFTAYDVLFNADSITQLEELTAGFKVVIQTDNYAFQNDIRNLMSFTPVVAGEYEQRVLDIGSWGSHDISLSRFSSLFGGLGNIVYFLAAMTAITIVLGGIRS